MVMDTAMETTMDTKMMNKNKYSDLHCHILPGIDDGSLNIDESIQMLKEMDDQGVKNIVATPHFYLSKMNIAKFIDKRNKSYSMLTEKLNADNNICLGAEVYYCKGIYRIEDFEKLALGKSNYILLELPYLLKIDIDVINDIESLMKESGFTVILAHIERFLDKLTWRASRKLFTLNVIYQINLSSIIDNKLIKPTLKFIKKGGFIVLGSDSHNINERSPKCYTLGLDIIQSHLGDAVVQKLINNTNNIYEEICG